MPRLVSLYGMPRVLIDADWRFAEEDFWHHSGTRSHPELGHQLLAATTLECRKNQKKHTRANTVFIWMYKTISSPGRLSATEVAYKWNWVY